MAKQLGLKIHGQDKGSAAGFNGWGNKEWNPFGDVSNLGEINLEPSPKLTPKRP